MSPFEFTSALFREEQRCFEPFAVASGAGLKWIHPNLAHSSTIIHPSMNLMFGKVAEPSSPSPVKEPEPFAEKV